MRGPEINLDYDSIPFLSSADFPEESGLDEAYHTTYWYFLSCVERALREPDWLFIATDTQKNRGNAQAGLPRAHFLTSKNIQYLQDLRKDPRLMNTLYEATHSQYFPFRINDIFARSLQVMSQDYPNLGVYRGAEFNENGGYEGLDFTAGDPFTALLFSHTSPFAGGRRAKPIFVSAKLSDITEGYSIEEVHIEIEDDRWWRNSIALVPTTRFKLSKMLLRRPPNCHLAEQEIITRIRQTAMKRDFNADRPTEGI